MDMSKWNHKDEWRRDGDNFRITVTRHTVDHPSEIKGQNRWCVYAYIYQKHRLFYSFDDSGMFQDAAMSLPFHCGCSFLKRHRDDDGRLTSVQVGADYDHLYDDCFCDYETAEDAYAVFNDAERIFDRLAGNDTEEG